jgi:hypothetical protein
MLRRASLTLVAALLVAVSIDSAYAQPDLIVSEFSLDPSTPTEGHPVNVRVGVYNQGNSHAGPFTVQWWAGENYPEPDCTWRLEALVFGAGRILTRRCQGYPSWYERINPKVVLDSAREVAETDEGNNIWTTTISVRPRTRRQEPDPVRIDPGGIGGEISYR